ncbi:MAG: hypothetical protein F6K40_06345 [Okeania sp. SIO3I5]|uniref:hypothetical protein n=1 Tax=Okeania sp. SIO3I5 TaxID=2607805 RepID=UPI0013BC169D|nr:hypothetical protein [Okeania sp. SIO3I5]NEQ35925.1 hypothetical protein [Okeania sp. SIO3I5]
MRLLNISPAKSVLPAKTVLEEVFTQVMSSSVMTTNEHQLIQSVLSGDDLDDDEYAIINRLAYCIRRGWVKLVE